MLPEAKKLSENAQAPPLERIQALLLASRFAFFHNQREAAVAMLNNDFDCLWGELGVEEREANPGLKTALHTLRVTLAETTQEAERLVEEENPSNADALVTLGCVYLQNDQAEEAYRTFRRVLELQPGHPYAR